MVSDIITAILLGMIIAATTLRVRQKRKDRREPVERRDDGPQLY